MSDPLGELFDLFVKERTYLHNVTAKTRSWYVSAWKAFLCSNPSGLTRQDLSAFVVKMRDRGVSARSVNAYLQALNAYGKWLHDEGHAETAVRLPLLKTERRVISVLSETQARVLVQYRPKGFTQLRTHTLDCLLLDTGLRIDEALGLQLSDIDLDSLLVTVTGKGRKQRRVPFSLEMRKRLFRFLKEREKAGVPGSLAFGSRNGTKWVQRNALRSHYLLLKRLGIPKSGFHRLRHSFATMYLRAGGEVVRLSRVMGHTQVSTTMVYEHLSTEDLSEAHQRLSVLNRLR